jgi:glycosyltransferase involved in cell wall biosynthesis
VPSVSLDQGLRGYIDELPKERRVGRGNVLHLTGWCFHTELPITAQELIVDGCAIPVCVRTLKRPDVHQQCFPRIDRHGYSLSSGFSVLVPVPECRQKRSLEVTLRARLRDGTVCSKPLGKVSLVPGYESIPWLPPRASQLSQPTVAICMTTFNPPLDLFIRQFRSIQRQTFANWVCLICDDGSRPKVFEQICRLVGEDPRFYVHQNSKHLGFYKNFEQCLGMVPSGVAYVALADHDDFWYPEKLATLLARFESDTTLVYSDMALVDREGRRQAGTYWTNRCNSYHSLASLLLANTVTGAAAIFRRQLIPYLLPFPDPVGQAFHDHWIACTALTLGKIQYVDQALYDYVQHSGNVIGHFEQSKASGAMTWRQILSPVQWKAKFASFFAHAKAIYFGDVLRIQHLAQILRLRCGRLVTTPKSRVLDRLTRLDSSLVTMSWLLARSRSAHRRRVTLGAEQRLLQGLWWRRLLSGIAWIRSRKMNRPVGMPAEAPICETPEPAPLPEALRIGMFWVEDLQQKMRPLAIERSPTAPRRVNLLIPNINFRYIFGGYLTKFHLARCLAESGHKVRIIFLDYCDYQPVRWKQELQEYPGLEQLLDIVEICYAYGRPVPIEMHPHDAIIATTWWSAHVAHQAVQTLGASRFIYLIQEYEPFTFPLGSWAALAAQTYTFPHLAVFSTEFLRDYFRHNALGVYAEGTETGDRSSFSFQNAITPVGPVAVDDLAHRSPRKLLFYARPESHAVRNMFEVGMLALIRAVKEGCFAHGWELYGIGTVGTAGMVRLDDDLSMHFLPRQDPKTYGSLLRGHDLGLSLMFTPHPSLVPIEMASAGMLTVTNIYANKTEAMLRKVSTNLIAVPATVEGVVRGLKQALANIDNYRARVQGARVQWATSWDQAFNAGIVACFEEFFEMAAGRSSAVPTWPASETGIVVSARTRNMLFQSLAGPPRGVVHREEAIISANER